MALCERSGRKGMLSSCAIYKKAFDCVLHRFWFPTQKLETIQPKPYNPCSTMGQGHFSLSPSRLLPVHDHGEVYFVVVVVFYT